MTRKREIVDLIVLLAFLGILISQRGIWSREPCSMDETDAMAASYE